MSGLGADAVSFVGALCWLEGDLQRAFQHLGLGFRV